MKIVDNRKKLEYDIKTGDLIITSEDTYLVARKDFEEEFCLISLDIGNVTIMCTDDYDSFDNIEKLIGFIEGNCGEKIREVIHKEKIKLVIE